MRSQELEGLLKMQDVIAQKLEELHYESKQDVYRVTKHDEAQVPINPANNKRLKYMAMVHVAMLFLVFGFFLMREVKATRVGNTETDAGSFVPSKGRVSSGVD